MININYMLNWARRQSSVLDGTLRVGIEEGEVIFRPAVGDTHLAFRSVDEATTHVRDVMGMTEVFRFESAARQPEDPYISRRTPEYVRKFHEKLREVRPEAHMEMVTYNIDSELQANQLHDIYNRGERGLFVPDRNKGRLIRIFEGGTEWSEQQIFDFMEERMGGPMIGEPFSDKLGKRLKGHFAWKMYEAYPGEPFKVGIMDASHRMDLGSLRADLETQFSDSTALRNVVDELSASPKSGQALSPGQETYRRLIREGKTQKQAAIGARMAEHANTVADGSMRVSRSAWEKLIGTQGELLKRLQSDYKRAVAAGDNVDANRLAREVEVLTGDIQRLRNVLDRGSGIANIRIGGGHIEQILNPGDNTAKEMGEVFRRMEREPWISKGNVILDTTGELERLGVDFLTHYRNIKFEGGMLTGPMQYLTMDLHRHGDAIIDLQSMSSIPEFFTSKFVEGGAQELLDDIKASINMLSHEDPRERRIPPGFRDKLESMLRNVDPAKRDKARGILQALEGGMSIADDPYLMRETVGLLFEAAQRTKGDFTFPKIKIPGAVRAEITAYHDMQGMEGVRKMAPGYLQFHEKSGTLIMHDADIVRYHHTFGGFDLDDALINIVRHERSGAEGTLHSLAIRQPNARGEHGFFKMYLDDDFIKNQVRKAGHFDVYNGALKELNRLNYDIDNTTKSIQAIERDIARQQQAIRGEGVSFPEEKRRNLNQLERKLSSYRQQLNKKQRALSTTEDFLNTVLGGGEWDQAIPATPGSPQREVKKRTYDAIFGSRSQFRDIPLGIKGDPIWAEREIAGKSVKGFYFRGREDVFYRELPQEAAEQFAGTRNVFQSSVENMAEQIRLKATSSMETFSNARMVLDHWWGTHQRVLETHMAQADHMLKADGLAFKRLGLEFYSRLEQIGLPPQEDVIDIAIQAGRDPHTVVRQKSDEMVALVVEMAARAEQMGIDLQIDPKHLDVKGRNMRARRMGIEAAREFGEVRESKIVMEANDKRASFSALDREARRFAEELESMQESIRISDRVRDYSEVRQSRMATSDAHRMIDAYRGVMDQFRNVGDELYAQAKFSAAGDAVIDAISGTFDMEGRATDRTYQAIIRAQQIIHESQYQSADYLSALWRVAPEEGGLMFAANQWLRNQSISRGMEDPYISKMTAETQEMISQLRAALTSDEAEVSEQIKQALDITDEEVRWKAAGREAVLKKHIAEQEEILKRLKSKTPYLVPEMTVDDIYESLGRLTRRGMWEVAPDIFDEGMLRPLEILDRTLTRQLEREPMTMPSQIRAALEAAEGPTLLPGAGGRMVSPFGGTVRLPGREEASLAEVLMGFRGMEPGPVKQKLAEQLNQAVTGYTGLLSQAALDDALPLRMQEEVLRFIERSDPERAAVAREAGARAAAAAEEIASTPFKRMEGWGANFLKDLMGTRAGRAGVIGSGILAAIGVIHGARKRGDRTLDEMQGPEHMPGGNPYQYDYASYPFSDVSTANYSSPVPQGSGVTYQVRTRGGDHDRSFLSRVGDITGASVRGTTYDTSMPFQSENERARILREYR